MKFFRPKNKAGFTLVEIMIVVLIIGILLAIAIPNFVSARESSRAKACVGNLKQIDSATQQWCMDTKKSSANYAAPVITTDLVNTSGASYIRAIPLCPSAGTYATATTITGTPQCTISGDGTTSGNTDTNYNTGNKFYHGL
jgi:prepilin-type N-terminal cleavage/methylation domain-containing protein